MKSAQAIRRMLVIVCLVAPLSVPGISSASTIGGTNCRKEGLLRQVGDAKFQCTRAKNGKLRWRPQTATRTSDRRRVVDNGYVDIHGKRIKGTGDLQIDNVYAKCGELYSWRATLWVEYNNGEILYETVIFNEIEQGGVISTDTFGLPLKYEIVVQNGGWEFDSIMCAITNNYSYPRK